MLVVNADRVCTNRQNTQDSEHHHQHMTVRRPVDLVCLPGRDVNRSSVVYRWQAVLLPAARPIVPDDLVVRRHPECRVGYDRRIGSIRSRIAPAHAIVVQRASRQTQVTVTRPVYGNLSQLRPRGSAVRTTLDLVRERGRTGA